MLFLSSSRKQRGCESVVAVPSQGKRHSYAYFQLVWDLRPALELVCGFSGSALGRKNLLFPMLSLVFDDKWSGHCYWQIHSRVCF